MYIYIYITYIYLCIASVCKNAQKGVSRGFGGPFQSLSKRFGSLPGCSATLASALRREFASMVKKDRTGGGLKTFLEAPRGVPGPVRSWSNFLFAGLKPDMTDSKTKGRGTAKFWRFHRRPKSVEKRWFCSHF